MKRWLLIGGVPLVLIALLFASIAFQPGAGPDVAIVKGEKPIAWRLNPQGAKIPKTEDRDYTIRMDWDEMIARLTYELVQQKGYSTDGRYPEVTFRKLRTEDKVVVTLGKAVPGEVDPGKGVVFMTDISGTYVREPSVNPRGWLIVKTTHSLGPIDGLLARSRRARSKRVGPDYKSYTQFQPEEIFPGQHLLVETDACYVSEWMGDN